MQSKQTARIEKAWNLVGEIRLDNAIDNDTWRALTIAEDALKFAVHLARQADERAANAALAEKGQRT